MTEARAAAARRTAEAAVRRDRLRQHNVDYLQPQQDAQRRIDTARHAYVALEQRIEQIHTAAQNVINQIRQQQAIAVWQMSHAGRTVQQIAELLEITQADTWQLLSAGRTAAAHATDDKPSHHTNPPDQQQPPAPHLQPAPPNTPPENNRFRAGSLLTNTARTLVSSPAITHRSDGARKRAAPDGTIQTRARPSTATIRQATNTTWAVEQD